MLAGRSCAGRQEVRGEGYGADQTVARVVGQLFGDQAKLDGQRGALTAHAVAPTVLLAVRREVMRDLLLPRGPPAPLQRAGRNSRCLRGLTMQPLFGSE